MKLKAKAQELIDVLVKLSSCVDGIVYQPKSDEWLSTEQRAVLLNLKESNLVQISEAQKIISDKANYMKPSRNIEDEVKDMGEVIERYEQQYQNLLGTLNHARIQNGLSDIRQDRDLN